MNMEFKGTGRCLRNKKSLPSGWEAGNKNAHLRRKTGISRYRQQVGAAWS